MSCFIKELRNIIEDKEVLKILKELEEYINDLKEEIRGLKEAG